MVQGFVDLVCSVSEPVGCIAGVVLWWFFVHRWISFIQYLLEAQWSVYVNLSLLNSYGGSALISSPLTCYYMKKKAFVRGIG